MNRETATPPTAAGASADELLTITGEQLVRCRGKNADGNEVVATFSAQAICGMGHDVMYRSCMTSLPFHTQAGEERAAQDDPCAKILSDIEELSSRFDWRMSPDKHGNHSIGHEELQRLLLDLKLLHKAVGQLPVVAPPSPEDDATVRVPNADWLKFADELEAFQPRGELGALHGAGMAFAYKDVAGIIRAKIAAAESGE